MSSAFYLQAIFLSNLLHRIQVIMRYSFALRRDLKMLFTHSKGRFTSFYFLSLNLTKKIVTDNQLLTYKSNVI